MGKPEYKRKICSDKVEINRYKMYRITDPLQFAHLFYPAKNASKRRAAFLAIYFEIKNAEDQKLDSLDHIPDKYGLSVSTVQKARVKMSRIGLIVKQRYGWQFSSIFRNTLEKLIELTEFYKSPIERPSQLIGETMWIKMAKGEDKKDQESDGKFTFGSDDSWISSKINDPDNRE